MESGEGVPLGPLCPLTVWQKTVRKNVQPLAGPGLEPCASASWQSEVLSTKPSTRRQILCNELQTMVKFQRLACLNHPLCTVLMDIKW